MLGQRLHRRRCSNIISRLDQRLVFTGEEASNDNLSVIRETPLIAISLFNPLSPHDALKHHFTSLKTYLIFLQLGVLE